jgi:hypothetical protein
VLQPDAQQEVGARGVAEEDPLARPAALLDQPVVLLGGDPGDVVAAQHLAHQPADPAVARHQDAG